MILLLMPGSACGGIRECCKLDVVSELAFDMISLVLLGGWIKQQIGALEYTDGLCERVVMLLFLLVGVPCRGTVDKCPLP